MDTGPNRPPSRYSLKNKDNKTALHLIWKNFTTTIRFIVAVLCNKTKAMSDLKFNSTSAKRITNRQHRSTGLIGTHGIGIVSIIIRAFSRNPN